MPYPGGDRFGREKFVLHYNDDEARPSFESLNLPGVKHGFNQTLVVCEDGALLLGDLGQIDLFRDGKLVESAPRPDGPERSHWHDWVDCCPGTKGDHQSPFELALRNTEPTILAAKATRLPNTELKWDGQRARFVHHEEANRTIVSREYRNGFGLPVIS